MTNAVVCFREGSGTREAKTLSEPRRQWKCKAGVVSEPSGNAKQMQCLSRAGGGSARQKRRLTELVKEHEPGAVCSECGPGGSVRCY